MNELGIENAVLKNLLRETVRAYEVVQRPLGGRGGDPPSGADVPPPAVPGAQTSEAPASELALLRETLRLLLLQSGDAVVSTDAQAAVVSLNPVAEKLMGLPSDAAAGKPLLHALLLVGADQAVVLDLAPCLLEGKDLELPAGVAVERPDGYRCTVKGRLTPVRDDAGKVSGLLIVMRPLEDTYLRAP